MFWLLLKTCGWFFRLYITSYKDWQAALGKLPSPHQIWCSLWREMQWRSQTPWADQVLGMFAFSAQVSSFLGLFLRGLGQRPSSGRLVGSGMERQGKPPITLSTLTQYPVFFHFFPSHWPFIQALGPQKCQRLSFGALSIERKVHIFDDSPDSPPVKWGNWSLLCLWPLAYTIMISD